jgi:hypothetical protein
MGKGYWVWLIPLGSGSTSVGIVADSALHPFNRINRFDRALDWLREFEPQCAEVVEAHTSELEDFLALQHFAHGCAQVFSAERWALTGEAGVFTDPFYSPGSDFIAMGNECIADLITREVRGEDIATRAEALNVTYLRLFDAFIRLYEGQYPIMGNAQVMLAKVTWDNGCYWAVTALLFFQRRLRRPEFIASIEQVLRPSRSDAVVFSRVGSRRPEHVRRCGKKRARARLSPSPDEQPERPHDGGRCPARSPS